MAAIDAAITEVAATLNQELREKMRSTNKPRMRRCCTQIRLPKQPDGSTTYARAITEILGVNTHIALGTTR